MIKEKGLKDTAAICSSIASTIYDLQILDSNIEDDDNNYTRFLLLSKVSYLSFIYLFISLISSKLFLSLTLYLSLYLSLSHTYYFFPPLFPSIVLLHLSPSISPLFLLHFSSISPPSLLHFPSISPPFLTQGPSVPPH